ncbi:MAG: phosphoribosylformylglycinamidine synthase subunit PurL [Ignavibacteria bacterium]|nr:phosphoribosylformylglycinamidine synthase subunit PurL [Ignavibacteria bacterium]
MTESYKQVGLSEDEYNLILKQLGREPNELELNLYGVMWSEHCGYKNSKLLLKMLPVKGERVLQGPGENAGALDIGDGDAVTMKVESHNHPSALSPYQGAATGVGGIVRDILAVGAYPVANLNSLYFGKLEKAHQRYLLAEVVKGIADYGNCLGIPTVAGEVHFDDAYEGNCLVNAMCVGLTRSEDLKTAFAKGPGNSVMVVGNLTGRDGMGGASFASQELTKESEENRSAVQVGDPFVEKLLIDACMEIFQNENVIGVQDMGAAGIISSTSETASKAETGIEIDIDLVPKRESGMLPYEVMISESQERMLLIVKEGKENEVNKIFHKWDLHAVKIGNVTDDGMIRVLNNGIKVGEVPAKSLTNPPLYKKDIIKPEYLNYIELLDYKDLPEPDNYNKVILIMLDNHNIASKEWIYRQYDHMVQLNTVVTPGSDAAVLRIKGKNKAIALTLDGNGRYVYLNPEKGSEIVIAEACRNLVASGAKPIGVTDCLNFGSPEKPDIYYQLYYSIKGLANACNKFNTPVVSGNVSLYNDTEYGSIYPTPTVGVLGLIEDLNHITDIKFKNADDCIYLIGNFSNEIGGSEYLFEIHKFVKGKLPELNLDIELYTQNAILEIIRNGLVKSCHDVSDGGIAVNLAESAVTGNFGIDVSINSNIRKDIVLFGEHQSMFVISAEKKNENKIVGILKKFQTKMSYLGSVTDEKIFKISVNGNEIINLDLAQISENYKNSISKMF